MLVIRTFLPSLSSKLICKTKCLQYFRSGVALFGLITADNPFWCRHILSVYSKLAVRSHIGQLCYGVGGETLLTLPKWTE